jgi:hypothetical protein
MTEAPPNDGLPAKPGDTIIELRDGVPYIGTEPGAVAGWDQDGGDYLDVTAAFNDLELRDEHGRWTLGGLVKKAEGLAVRQRFGHNGHDVDRTANKGYRVRLKTGEVQHYDKAADAARAAHEGKHFNPGGVPVKDHAPTPPRVKEHVKPPKPDVAKYPPVPETNTKQARSKWFTQYVTPQALNASDKMYPGNKGRWDGTILEERNPPYYGMMEWVGGMHIHQVPAQSIAETFHPDHSKPTYSPKGIQVLLHELTHSIGSGGPYAKNYADRTDYQTKVGHDIEESFTEIGAWTEMGTFLKQLGLYDRPLTGHQDLTVKPQMTLGQWYERYVTPDMLMGGERNRASPHVAYDSITAKSYRFLDKVAQMELIRDGKSNVPSNPKDRFGRVKELAHQVNAESGPQKRDAMAKMFIEAAGYNPNTKIHRGGEEMTVQQDIARQIKTDWNTGPTPTAYLQTELDYLKGQKQLRRVQLKQTKQKSKQAEGGV